MNDLKEWFSIHNVEKRVLSSFWTALKAYSEDATEEYKNVFYREN